MDNDFLNFSNIKNIEKPFTELFTLLKQPEVLPQGDPTLLYKTSVLKIMNHHAENAMEIMFQGLQDLGQIINFLAKNHNEYSDEIENLGCFISIISNLTQALHELRIDSHFVLEQRKIN